MSMPLRLSDDEMVALKALAALEGITTHEAVRQAVREYLARGERREQFEAAAARVLENHADVIERLGR